MQAIRPIQIILMILMLAAAAGAYYLTPTIKMAEQRKVNLEQMIPQQFGDWKMLPNQHVIELPPELAANLSRIYTETLSRTYVNSKGQQVMLSIAYGADQSDGMGVHRPEICYPAQGFYIRSNSESTIAVNSTELPIKKLVGESGMRIEPITYWMVIGNDLVNNARQQKLSMVRQGLAGVIPDGSIVRISSIGSDVDNQFELHAEYIRALSDSLDSIEHDIFFGKQ